MIYRYRPSTFISRKVEDISFHLRVSRVANAIGPGIGIPNDLAGYLVRQGHIFRHIKPQKIVDQRSTGILLKLRGDAFEETADEKRIRKLKRKMPVRLYNEANSREYWAEPRSRFTFRHFYIHATIIYGNGTVGRYPKAEKASRKIDRVYSSIKREKLMNFEFVRHWAKDFGIEVVQ